jgi:hypothetical protein
MHVFICYICYVKLSMKDFKYKMEKSHIHTYIYMHTCIYDMHYFNYFLVIMYDVVFLILVLAISNTYGVTVLRFGSLRFSSLGEMV